MVGVGTSIVECVEGISRGGYRGRAMGAVAPPSGCTLGLAS